MFLVFLVSSLCDSLNVWQLRRCLSVGCVCGLKMDNEARILVVVEKDRCLLSLIAGTCHFALSVRFPALVAAFVKTRIV